MEMSASQLALRLISSNGRVNSTRLRTVQLEDEDWSRVSSAIRMLKESKIFIDDTPALSPEVLRAKAPRLKRENDLGLIVIDYLQLMAVTGNSENRATEISEISRSLKRLAKEIRSEEHTSELQSLMRISYDIFCLKKTKQETH